MTEAEHLRGMGLGRPHRSAISAGIYERIDAGGVFHASSSN